MPTAQAKHKRVLRDGQVSRGPERWARAAANAFAKPNSAAGRLYLDRVANAHEVRKHWEDTGPSVHLGDSWSHAFNHRVVDESKRLYYTCSLYCTAMQAQLDFGGEMLSWSLQNGGARRDGFDTAALAVFLEVDERIAPVWINPREYRAARTVRCQCCGTDIKPGVNEGPRST